MGISHGCEHLAYHTNIVNLLIHALCIPGIMLGFLQIARSLGGIVAAYAVIAAVGVCVLRTDVIMGGTYTTVLFALLGFAKNQFSEL